MLGAQLCLRSVTGVGSVSVQTNAGRSIPSSSPTSSCSLNFTVGFGLRAKRCFGPKSIFVCCKSSSRGSFGSRSNNDDDRDDHDYVEASLLLSGSISLFLSIYLYMGWVYVCVFVPEIAVMFGPSAETISHYSMRRRGFQEDWKWKPSSRWFPFSANTIGLGFLRRFQSPTMFLKISCDGDFLLPIVVGIKASIFFFFVFPIILYKGEFFVTVLGSIRTMLL